MHKYQLIWRYQLDEWKRSRTVIDGPLTCITCGGHRLKEKGVGEIIRYTGSSHHAEYIMNPCYACSGTGDREDTFDNRLTVAFVRRMDELMFEELKNADH